MSWQRSRGYLTKVVIGLVCQARAQRCIRIFFTILSTAWCALKNKRAKRKERRKPRLESQKFFSSFARRKKQEWQVGGHSFTERIETFVGTLVVMEQKENEKTEKKITSQTLVSAHWVICNALVKCLEMVLCPKSDCWPTHTFWRTWWKAHLPFCLQRMASSNAP